MSTLVKGQQHPFDLLALYVQEDGKLKDAFKVEYTVFQETGVTGLPGEQILPASGRTEVTTGGGHVATGVYGVFDPVTSAAWAPSEVVTRGWVRWFYTLNSGDAERIIERRFEVLDDTLITQPVQNFALVKDVLEAIAPRCPTTRSILVILAQWTKMIHNYVRQRLLPVREVRRHDWRVGADLFLDEVLFAMSSFTPEGEDAIEQADLLVLGGTGLKKRNPRIALVQDTTSSIFTTTTAVRTIRFGPLRRRRVTVDGVWGNFDETTFEAPLDVRVVTLDVIKKIIKKDTSRSGGGPLRRERTDGHEVEFGVLVQPFRTEALAMLRSRELREVLDVYKAPIALAMSGGIS